MKSKLKGFLISVTITVAVFLAFSVISLVQIKIRDAMLPKYETRYLTADEEKEYKKLSREYVIREMEVNLLEEEREQMKKLSQKKNRTEDEDELLKVYEDDIASKTEIVSAKPSMEELSNMMNALGTTEPENGVNYPTSHIVKCR